MCEPGSHLDGCCFCRGRSLRLIPRAGDSAWEESRNPFSGLEAGMLLVQVMKEEPSSRRPQTTDTTIKTEQKAHARAKLGPDFELMSPRQEASARYLTGGSEVSIRRRSNEVWLAENTTSRAALEEVVKSKTTARTGPTSQSRIQKPETQYGLSARLEMILKHSSGQRPLVVGQTN